MLTTTYERPLAEEEENRRERCNQLAGLRDGALNIYQGAFDAAEFARNEIAAIQGVSVQDRVRENLDRVSVGATWGAAGVAGTNYFARSRSTRFSGRMVGAGLGGITGGYDALQSYRAYQRGDVYEGRQRAAGAAIAVLSVAGGPAAALIAATGGTAISRYEARRMNQITEGNFENLHDDINRRESIMGTARQKLSEYGREWGDLNCNEFLE